MNKASRGTLKFGVEVLICLWLIVLSFVTFFLYRLIHIYAAQSSQLLWGMIFIFCFDFLWIYIIYHLWIMINAKLLNRDNELQQPSVLNIDFPRIAILYPTRNDLKEEAIKSCLNQDYSNYDVFILDDSSSIEWRNKVDLFVSQQKSKINLIRRPYIDDTRAGNLDYALDILQKKYPYFAISDADGILPPNFLKKLIPCMIHDKKIAFVQASQRINPAQKEYFPCVLGREVECYSHLYHSVKNLGGFVMFAGHAGILRTSCWKEIGGFKDNITEDIAFSSKIRERGYYGIYTDQSICLEDFPKDMSQLRKRNAKWTSGMIQFFNRNNRSFLHSKHISWFEKIDLWLGIGAYSFIQPRFIILLLFLSISFFPPYLKYCLQLMNLFFGCLSFSEFQSDLGIFYAIVLVTMVMVFFIFVLSFSGKIKNIIIYWIYSIYAFWSTAWLEFVVLIMSPIKRIQALNTFDQEKITNQNIFSANHPVVLWTETFLGCLICFIGVATQNFWLFFVSVLSMIGPIDCLFKQRVRIA